jgi:hypothetical protein
VTCTYCGGWRGAYVEEFGEWEERPCPQCGEAWWARPKPADGFFVPPSPEALREAQAWLENELATMTNPEHLAHCKRLLEDCKKLRVLYDPEAA